MLINMYLMYSVSPNTTMALYITILVEQSTEWNEQKIGVLEKSKHKKV